MGGRRRWGSPEGRRKREAAAAAASSAAEVGARLDRLVAPGLGERPPVETRITVQRARTVARKGGGLAYELAPMDPDEAWLFHEWMGELVKDAKAVAFDTGRDGEPTGYREKRRGGWDGELTNVGDVASYEPGWVLRKLAELSIDQFSGLVHGWASWWPRLIQGLARQPDGPFSSMDQGQIDEAIKMGRRDPPWLRRLLLGLPSEAAEMTPERRAAAFLLGLADLARTVREIDEGPPDYDPVRDGPMIDRRAERGRAARALAFGLDLLGAPARRAEEEARRRRQEGQEEARRLVEETGAESALPDRFALPPPKLPAELRPQLRHEMPIKTQTRRVKFLRDPSSGKLTGAREVVTVPTMRIDLHSYLGQSIRVIDDDTGRGDPPRGAIGMIRSSAKKRQWIVPAVEGHYRGSKREDPRRAALRESQGAEVIQLADHRTGKARTVEVLVTPRSKFFSLAMEFAEEFDRLAAPQTDRKPTK